MMTADLVEGSATMYCQVPVRGSKQVWMVGSREDMVLVFVCEGRSGLMFLLVPVMRGDVCVFQLEKRFPGLLYLFKTAEESRPADIKTATSGGHWVGDLQTPVVMFAVPEQRPQGRGLQTPHSLSDIKVPDTNI